MSLSNAEIMNRVHRYQNIGHFHSLTCQVDSRHETLQPMEEAGAVVLVCPTCKHIQENIPEFVLAVDLDLAEAIQKVMEKHSR